MDDTEIIALYWNRDERAIPATAERYEAYLSAAAYRILSDREDVRECVNDAYLRAWNGIPPHRPENLPAFLGKLIRRLAIDRWRKRTSMKRGGSEYELSLEELGDILAPGRDPETEFEARHLKETISDFVKKLPETERYLFLARYYFFDPLKKAAKTCGISESKAKSMLYRTRKKLKAHLEQEGFTL